MKVLHIQGGDLSYGSAKGALGLHQALRKIGIDSSLLIQHGESDFDGVFNLETTRMHDFSAKMKRYIDSGMLKFYKNKEKRLFSLGNIGNDITKLDDYKHTDIVHLHWINEGMMDIKSIGEMDKPIVWTFRDMWPFTGGCHYALGCSNYKFGCGSCKQLNSCRKYDLSRWVVQKKKRNFGPNIFPVAISRWLGNCAEESYLFKSYDTQVIPNCTDTEVFHPIDKGEARRQLNIPDKNVILVGAKNINNIYKGFNKFVEALEILDKNKFYLFFGEFDENEMNKFNINYKSFGFINDLDQLRILYSAADVFVAPSIQEAFGKTIIEAMACGTPVVCFNATGPKDIVDHKVNGYRAEPFKVADLAAGIDWILSNEGQNLNLGQKAREKVTSEFSMEVVARKYRNLYETII